MIEKDIRDRLAPILSSNKDKAEYIEIRLEESESTRIMYRGREVEDVARSSAVGGNVRALVKGGWGFVSFNDFGRINEWMSLAISQATHVGKEKSLFTSLPPVTDRVLADRAKKDPDTVPLAEKKALLDQYNEAIWSIPGIQTSIIAYGDGRKQVFFANSEGSFIEQNRKDVNLRVAAVARKDSEVQQAGLSLGSKGDFSKIEGLHDEIRKMAKLAVDLLSAPKIKGGEYTVVLDPVLAGVFVHEAFGHLSESDFLYENPQLKEVMTLGRRFGGKHLNIVDGAAIPGLRGSYKYDDEGTPARRTYLIKEGVLVGRLHSRETAAKMGEPPSGNARAIDYRFPPIVRMTNTIIEPGKASLEDILSDIQEGVYVKNWYGGTTSMEMFTFSAGEAYMVRKGKIAEPIRPVTLTGNVFSTLQNLDGIANDIDMNQGGGCGKGGQFPLPVSNGSPHIRIRSCLVGGR
ncbi:MAG: TldD/PmbA family protein [Chloroflexi bacterium]|nr:TldD/PmbA family protein [Chloroflexota bacterium]